jgi:hypothetical protein
MGQLVYYLIPINLCDVYQCRVSDCCSVLKILLASAKGNWRAIISPLMFKDEQVPQDEKTKVGLPSV